MSIDVTWQQEFQFTVTSENGQQLAVDANGEKALCPTELLLAGLGSCSVTDVIDQLTKRGVEIISLRNQVSYTMTDTEPSLYKTANLHFLVEAKQLDPAWVNEAIDNALEKYCHVCLMLKPAIDVSYSSEIKVV